MAEVVLDHAHVEASIDQRIAARVTKHVSMKRQAEEFVAIAESLHQHVEANRLHRRAAFPM